MIKIRSRVVFLVGLAICLCSTLFAVNADTSAPIYSYNSRIHPLVSQHGMVASQEALATDVGVTILKQGGNAVDAAVATGFALAVTLPRAGNLGGGGFMMVFIASENRTIAIDYRETAPTASYETMFLDEHQNLDVQKSRYSVLASGVPGTVYGLTYALEQFGTMSLAEVMAPAIALAKDGFEVSFDLSESLKSVQEDMKQHPSSYAIFFPGKRPLEPGDRLVQKDLGWSLEKIKNEGRSAFYSGDIAEKITSYMKVNEGVMSASDLANYTVATRNAVTGNYRGYTVASMPPPSSGGVHLIQMLNVLENFDLNESGLNSAQTIHLYAEVMKRAFADRSFHLGDPDFTPVPVDFLTSKQYAKQIAQQIQLNRRTESRQIYPEPERQLYESDETTHFSVVDRFGNAVSNTYTLNFSYGNRHVVPGTGILLNNEMDDFSSRPGEANAYGLIGGSKNAIEPNKRMLSSMTPTFVFNPEGDLYLVTGTPGGPRIITTTLQIILNVIDFEMNIAEATLASRVHHQWFPEELRVEDGLSYDTLSILKDLGYRIEKKAAMGSSQSIVRRDNHLEGFSDTRKPGALTKGY